MAVGTVPKEPILLSVYTFNTLLIDWLLGSTVVELCVGWVDGEVLEHFPSKGSSLIAKTWWFDATHDSDTIVNALEFGDVIVDVVDVVVDDDDSNVGRLDTMGEIQLGRQTD